jgi:hypothetical protein
VLACALAVGLVCGPVDAEVGCVHVGAASGDGYIFSIQEDPNPVPSIWLPVSPEGTFGRIVLNAQGATNGDGPPRMVEHPVTGGPIVVWSRNAHPGYDVVVSRFVGGAWTEPVVVAGTADDELDPFVTVDPADGSVHVVYWTSTLAPQAVTRVLHVQAPADLSSWSAPVEVSAPGEVAVRPAAAFHGGKLHVVYELQVGDGPPYLVALASYSGVFDAEGILGTSQFGGPLWPEIHSTGSALWVEWIDDVDSMAWLEQPPGQPWGSILSEPYTTLEDRELFARGRIRSQVLD